MAALEQAGEHEMHTFHVDGGSSSVSRSRVGEYDFEDQPGIALLHALADSLIELLGPMFWAVLIVLFICKPI